MLRPMTVGSALHLTRARLRGLSSRERLRLALPMAANLTEYSNLVIAADPTTNSVTRSCIDDRPK